jgi:hypothetical protein
LGLAVSTYTNRLHKTGGKDDDNSSLQHSLPYKTNHQNKNRNLSRSHSIFVLFQVVQSVNNVYEFLFIPVKV